VSFNKIYQSVAYKHMLLGTTGSVFLFCNTWWSWFPSW